MSAETPCIQHEEQIQRIARKTAELEARADFKEKRIDDLQQNLKDMNLKIDTINKNVNDLLLKSVNDDKEIDKRVTSLENTVQVLKWVITLIFGSGIIWILYNFVH